MKTLVSNPQCEYLVVKDQTRHRRGLLGGIFEAKNTDTSNPEVPKIYSR